MTLEIPADTARLAELGAFLRDACPDHPQPVLVELAVVELVTNAILHGAAHTCRLEVADLGGCYRVTASDDGRPFNPLDAEQMPLGELREGGYGIAIVRRIGRDLAYHRDGDWNALSLSFCKEDVS